MSFAGYSLLRSFLRLSRIQHLVGISWDTAGACIWYFVETPRSDCSQLKRKTRTHVCVNGEEGGTGCWFVQEGRTGCWFVQVQTNVCVCVCVRIHVSLHMPTCHSAACHKLSPLMSSTQITQKAPSCIPGTGRRFKKGVSFISQIDRQSLERC